MRIRIVECDTEKEYIYNINQEYVQNNIKAYEYIYMYDNDMFETASIEMAVKYYFGENSYFDRNILIHDYITGTIFNDNEPVEVLIFFED